MGCALQHVSLLRGKFSSILLGVDEAIALGGSKAAHAADGTVQGLAPLRRKLAELLKELVRLLLLAGRQMLPRFHAGEHALLLLGRQAGEMLQAILQLPLLLRRKTAELGIVFQRSALLGGGEILIAAQPGSGVAGLIGRVLLIGGGASIALEVVPLAVGVGGRAAVLGERGRQRQEGGQTDRDLVSGQHMFTPTTGAKALKVQKRITRP